MLAALQNGSWVDSVCWTGRQHWPQQRRQDQPGYKHLAKFFYRLTTTGGAFHGKTFVGPRRHACGTLAATAGSSAALQH